VVLGTSDSSNSNAAASSTAPQSGAFGRYRELAILGQGGMARVLLVALDGPHGVQKLLVIKEMLPELAEDSEYVTMFCDEARLASRLDHPNVVHTYELVEKEGRYFFVMEYLDGQPLSSIYARTKREIPLGILLRVFSRLLAGLHYAHELTDIDGTPLKIVHRDVTPQNVFLGYGGVVKLVDFGIAKAVGAGTKTAVGMFKGKLAYAAPEQLGDGPIDKRADVFAVGVLLWEALAKQRINKDLAEPQLFSRRLSGDPPILDVAPTTPPVLAAIVTKAMAKDRNERYQSAEEMKVDLEKAIDELGVRMADEEIGAFVGGLFENERSTVRKLVKEQMTTSSGRIAVPTLVRATESSPSGMHSLPRQSSGSHPSFGSKISAVPQPVPRKWYIVGAAVAVIGLILGISQLFRKPDKPVLPDVPQMVDIKIAVAPTTAKITVDGIDVASPYTSKTKRSGTHHKLVATLAGYKDTERDFTCDRDLDLELAMEAVPAEVTDPPPVSVATTAAPAPAPAPKPQTRPWPGAKPAPKPNPSPYGNKW
jgi:serine/threonine-protein kinase